MMALADFNASQTAQSGDLGMIDFSQFEVISFNCYGTLIDWETGILACLQPMLKKHGVEIENEVLLEEFAKFELVTQKRHFQSYTDVLRHVVALFGRQYRFQPTDAELDTIWESIPLWEPFSDSIQALRALEPHYDLAIISNITDSLLSFSVQKLEVEFDWLITAEQAHAYKPALTTFQYALGRIGIPKRRVLHVAQSCFHDIAPTSRLGMKNVLVNRRRGREGSGATWPSPATANYEIPNLSTLVDLLADSRKEQP